MVTAFGLRTVRLAPWNPSTPAAFSALSASQRVSNRTVLPVPAAPTVITPWRTWVYGEGEGKRQEWHGNRL